MRVPRWSIWSAIYSRMSRVILLNFMHPRGKGGEGGGRRSPLLVCFHNRALCINHTSSSATPAPTLTEKVKSEMNVREEGSRRHFILWMKCSLKDQHTVLMKIPSNVNQYLLFCRAEVKKKIFKLRVLLLGFDIYKTERKASLFLKYMWWQRLWIKYLSNGDSSVNSVTVRFNNLVTYSALMGLNQEFHPCNKWCLSECKQQYKYKTCILSRFQSGLGSLVTCNLNIKTMIAGPFVTNGLFPCVSICMLETQTFVFL